ncbi:MAG: outer rane assembly lipoprotein YfgL [Proteobacteria bacterium]|nr:outer rane assembly lipoprotein YfgL [Pseudomonadota bacterium]
MRGSALLLALFLIGGCSTLDNLNPFSSSSKVKMAELTPINPSADLRLSWKGALGEAGNYTFVPAVIGDTVYAAARNGAIARFDGGTEAWRINAGQSLSGGVGADAALVVVGTPKGEVLAYDTRGQPLWKARVSSEVLAPPAFADGAVIVRSGDSRIFCLDARDGKQRWVYQRTTPPLSLRGPAGVAVADKLVLAGFPGGKLVAISSANGAAVWEASVTLPRGSTELERVADVTGTPVVSGRAVCAAAYQGRVGCFDLAGGNALWAREMSSDVGLDVDDRFVYVTDDKSAVHALDRSNGASMWKQDKLFMRGVSRPVAAGPYILVGDVAGVVHALKREDGSFAARFSTDSSGVIGEPRKFASGAAVQTRDGGLYALTVQ